MPTSSRSNGNEFVYETRDLKYKYQAGAIEHNVAYG